MATLKKTISTKVESLVRIPAAEIEAMLRERYPQVPAVAGMTVLTDAGLHCEALDEVRFDWHTNEGDSNEAEFPRTELLPKEPAALKLTRDPEE